MESDMHYLVQAGLRDLLKASIRNAAILISDSEISYRLKAIKEVGTKGITIPDI